MSVPKVNSQGSTQSTTNNSWIQMLSASSTRTKICLFLSTNPIIASGLLVAFGASLPFHWPVTLLLGGVFSLIFFTLAAASNSLEMPDVDLSKRQTTQVAQTQVAQ